MALVAARTTTGFEPVYNKVCQQVPNPVPYELTPNTAFSKGDLVALSSGKVAKCAAGAAPVLGVMAASYTTAQNPAGKTTFGLVYDHPYNVYRCTFAGHRDAAPTGGSTTTIVDTALATSADSVWNGAFLYVYDGPGAGSMRTVKSYTGASDTLTVEEPFPAAITTASRYILLGAASTSGDVINIGKPGVDITNEHLINAAASVLSGGAEQGPLQVLDIVPQNLTMDVLIRKHALNGY